MEERESFSITRDRVKPFIESLGSNYSVVDATDSNIIVEHASQLKPTVVISKIDDVDEWRVSFISNN